RTSELTMVRPGCPKRVRGNGGTIRARSGSLELTKKPLHLGPLRSRRGETGEERARFRRGLGPSIRFRIRNRQVEARLVEVGIDGERRPKRLNGRRQVAFAGLQDA